MTLTHSLGIALLVLLVAVELFGVWLLPRIGVVDPTAGLLGAALGGALAGGLAVWLVLTRR
jgi:hypothetical protein